MSRRTLDRTHLSWGGAPALGASFCRWLLLAQEASPLSLRFASVRRHRPATDCAYQGRGAGVGAIRRFSQGQKVTPSAPLPKPGIETEPNDSPTRPLQQKQLIILLVSGIQSISPVNCLRRRWAREEERAMKGIRTTVICFVLAASVLAGASIAGAEEALPEPTTTESEPTTPEGAGPSESSLLEEDGCIANFVCVESGTEYNNAYKAWTCEFDSGAHGLEGNRFSATNRCGNKTNWLRVNGNAIACMNPGGNRPHPGAFNEIFIAAEFGSFC